MFNLRFFDFGGDKHARVKQISVHDVYERVQKETIKLIDVRHSREWTETGRPQGSYGVTLQDPEFVSQIFAILDDDREKPVALSCRTGGRSSRGAEMLLHAAFTDVSVVIGGFFEWRKQNLPIEQAPFKR